jgi:cell division protein FtsB
MHWCNLHYTNVLRLRPQKEIADPPKPSIMTLDQTITALQQSHEALRAEVAKLKDSDLDDNCNSTGASVAEFVSACVRHEVWHSSQIAVARRLFREAEPTPAAGK